MTQFKFNEMEIKDPAVVEAFKELDILLDRLITVVQAIDPPALVVDITDDYTLLITDKDKTIRRTGSTAGVVVTIPANSVVPFAEGDIIAVSNNGTDAITIAITTDTLTWAADNTTGTRTLAPGGIAVFELMDITSPNWTIAGKQLT